MGGRAFNSQLGEDKFPRIPPETYDKLKATLGEKLKELYIHVGTPTEAPEKADHGDVDFIVEDAIGEVSHHDIQKALDARYAVVAEGNRTSNYAVLIPGQEGMYYQVDVHVCADKTEWDNIMFFHSYGDMGMILGIMAKAHGLTLGTKGLKVNSFPQMSFIPSLIFFILRSIRRSPTRLILQHINSRPLFRISLSSWVSL